MRRYIPVRFIHSFIHYKMFSQSVRSFHTVSPSVCTGLFENSIGIYVAVVRLELDAARIHFLKNMTDAGLIKKHLLTLSCLLGLTLWHRLVYVY